MAGPATLSGGCFGYQDNRAIRPGQQLIEAGGGLLPRSDDVVVIRIEQLRQFPPVPFYHGAPAGSAELVPQLRGVIPTLAARSSNHSNRQPVRGSPVDEQLQRTEQVGGMICDEQGVAKKSIDDAAIKGLQNYDWTGNIRELRNVVERLVILSDKTITKKDVEQFVSY